MDIKKSNYLPSSLRKARTIAFIAAVFIGLFLNENTAKTQAFLQFSDFFAQFIPAINHFADYSNFPNFTRFSNALQWIFVLAYAFLLCRDLPFWKEQTGKDSFNLYLEKITNMSK